MYQESKLYNQLCPRNYFSDSMRSAGRQSIMSINEYRNNNLIQYLPQYYIPNVQRSRYNNTKNIKSKYVPNSEILSYKRSSDSIPQLTFLEKAKYLDKHLANKDVTNVFKESYDNVTQKEYCGLVGLRNIGNTCFMNTVIQCLSNTKSLLEYLVNENYLKDINITTSNQNGQLIKTFSLIIKKLWMPNNSETVDTSSLKFQVQKIAPSFVGYSQQDAQEFLRYLLEGLHADVNRITRKSYFNYSNNKTSAEYWKCYLSNENSEIVDIFVGQLRSSLKCTVCNHTSITYDPFWDLSLSIPSDSSSTKLNNCLEYFTREEVLDGDDKPSCSKCQKKRKCTKSLSIQKFPKVLVIHLKRFSPMERFRDKLNVFVDFPLENLDMNAFSAPQAYNHSYSLYGIINHSGTTFSGHYTAFCKHPYSKQWHKYDDSRVTSISENSVISNKAYVLFYEQ